MARFFLSPFSLHPLLRRCRRFVWFVWFFGVSAVEARIAERLLPLASGHVSQAVGTVFSGRTANEAKPTVQGTVLSTQRWFSTGPRSSAELLFSDGTRLRMWENTRLTLFPDERRIWLTEGRVLVVSDRMTGGLAVLSDFAALIPEGTSYLVEAKRIEHAPKSLTITVIEGAVCACFSANASQRGVQPTRDAMVLPGEKMYLDHPFRRPMPHTVRLAQLVASEPLWVGFSRPVPESRWIKQNLEQQRR